VYRVRHSKNKNGVQVCEVSSEGLDFAEIVEYGRETGGVALLAMTFHDRPAALRAMCKHLTAKKDDFYAISGRAGASEDRHYKPHFPSNSMYGNG